MDADDLETKTVQTYDATAGNWSKSRMQDEWEPVRRKFKKFLPAGKILEIGCGGGRDAAALTRAGYDYLGTDASAGMIQVATHEVPHAAFRQLSLYNLAELPEKFDGFWACDVLLHIPKARIDEALTALSSVLKAGVIGMISVKDGDREYFEVRDHHGNHEERLFVYWTKDVFTSVLRRNGFGMLDYMYRPVSERTNWHIFFVQKNY